MYLIPAHAPADFKDWNYSTLLLLDLRFRNSLMPIFVNC